MRRREREHSNRMRTRVRKEVLERTRNPELVRGIIERSMYGKIFRANDDNGKNEGDKCTIGTGKSFAWLITDQYGNLNDTYFELLADAAARIVDKEYGVGTGVDEDEKAAKMSAVKARLTRQLTGGITKAAARFYRLRLERACTLASSRHNAALEAEPIDPRLLGGATLLHAGSNAFDDPTDNGPDVDASTHVVARDGLFVNDDDTELEEMDMFEDNAGVLHSNDASPSPLTCAGDVPHADANTSPISDTDNASPRSPTNEASCCIRRGGAGLFMRQPRKRGLRGFVKDPRSGSANSPRSFSDV